MSAQQEIQDKFWQDQQGVTTIQQQIGDTFMNPGVREYVNQYPITQDHARGIQAITAQINATYNRGFNEFYTQPFDATQRQAPQARVERNAERVA